MSSKKMNIPHLQVKSTARFGVLACKVRPLQIRLKRG
jgi:hypothetical protein